MLEEDRDSYLCMLKYLVRKHRCGVIGDCHHGIKDFYLVPLIEGEDVATQLLPFKGPGKVTVAVLQRLFHCVAILCSKRWITDLLLMVTN